MLREWLIAVHNEETLADRIFSGQTVCVNLMFRIAFCVGEKASINDEVLAKGGNWLYHDKDNIQWVSVSVLSLP